MIVSGLIGSTVGGGDNWVFFGFSILCYLPVIYYLCERKNRAIDNRIFDEFGNPDVDLGTAGASNRSAFQRLRLLQLCRDLLRALGAPLLHRRHRLLERL